MFAAAGRPVKIAVQGPLFLAFCCTDQHYGGDTKALAMDHRHARSTPSSATSPPAGSTGSRFTNR